MIFKGEFAKGQDGSAPIGTHHGASLHPTSAEPDAPEAITAVLDTNVVIGGLLSASGAPRQVVDAGLTGRFQLVHFGVNRTML